MTRLRLAQWGHTQTPKIPTRVHVILQSPLQEKMITKREKKMFTLYSIFTKETQKIISIKKTNEKCVSKSERQMLTINHIERRDCKCSLIWNYPSISVNHDSTAISQHASWWFRTYSSHSLSIRNNKSNSIISCDFFFFLRILLLS